ncbi:HEXXH motif domain-containing protein [Cryptosporangium sp. NPDC051539]|uniref:HEXXH motif domain-containing protein n=1 Tax=Cryptosporangium sp. NPDC051539 TaxID=3363962 RepID=UPI003788990B
MSAPTRASSVEELASALAAGTGPAVSVGRLYSGQLKIRTSRLRALVAKAGDADPSGLLIESYATLRAVQASHPRIVTALLLYPHVGAWLADSLRRLDPARATDGAPHAGPGYLSGLAAAAVLRAGTGATARLTVTESGQVFLPTLGTCLLPAGPASTWRLEGHRITDGQRDVPLPADLSEQTDTWVPIRRLRSDHGAPIDVAFDDQDPARTCGPHLTLSSRLGEVEWAAWQRAFDDGWAMLRADHPEYADGIRAGLQCVVPLDALGGGSSSSLTVGDAFGAVVTTPPADGGAIALTLVHEFQHNKLSALLDLGPLYEGDSDERFYAPWRDDPRPFGAVLQGVYAHLGVTDFWRVHRWSAPEESAALAHLEFTRWRQQTEEAAAELARASVVTDLGRDFLAVISGRLAQWGTEPVPGSAEAAAAAARFEHRIGWRLRNMRLTPAQIALLADAVRDEPLTPLDAPVDARAMTVPWTQVWSARLRLMYAAVDRPDFYERLRSGAETVDDPVAVSDADLACLVGDYQAAEPIYEAEIAAGGSWETGASWEAWAGLVHCYRITRPGPAADFLRTRPEVVAAVHAVVGLSPYETARRLAEVWP